MYEFIRAKAAMMRHSMGSENMDEHQGSSKKQKVQSGLAMNSTHHN